MTKQDSFAHTKGNQSSCYLNREISGDCENREILIDKRTLMKK